jgi:hypothetical protein
MASFRRCSTPTGRTRAWSWPASGRHHRHRRHCHRAIAEIAVKAGERSAPLNNGPISDAEMADIRSRYDEILAACARTPGGFEHEPDRRGFYEVTREERIALWDRLYEEPGFGIWLANFREIFTDEAANAEFSSTSPIGSVAA